MSLLSRVPMFSLRSLTRARVGYIGVDLGSREIKLAQLVQTDGQYRLAHTSRIPLPEHATYAAASLETGWLEETLKPAFFYGGGFRGRSAAAVLSMSVTELRSIEVPPGSRDDRRAMISHELQESSGSLDPVEFDFWDADRTGQPDNAPHLAHVLSVSANVATQIAEQMQRAGLYCRLLDGGPLALARSILLDSSLSAATEPIGILDWGYHAVQFVIAQRGCPTFTRLLKGCGIGQLITQVTRKLEISEEESSGLISAVGIASSAETPAVDADLQAMINEFAVEPFRHLSAELQKTLAFLRQQRPECVPGVIVLTGGGATIRNMSKLLAADIRMPVSRWQPRLRERTAEILPASSLEVYAQAAALSALEWEP